MVSWSDFAFGAAVPASLWILKELFVPDLLDRRKQERQAQSELRKEQRAYAREDEPVRQRILAAIKAEAEITSGAISRRTFWNVEFWNGLRTELAALNDEKAARALGDDYQLFVRHLRTDDHAVMRQRHLYEDRDGRIASAATDEGRLYNRTRADALTFQNMGVVMYSTIALLRVLGDAEYADYLAKLMSDEEIRLDSTLREVFGSWPLSI